MGAKHMKEKSNQLKHIKTLAEKYSPSQPCRCETCLGYCKRPGWWTVEEAARALEAAYGNRMMLEMAPDQSFGVLSPAFRGNEVDFARKIFESQGCTFLKDGLCELYGTGLQPLECRFCHHDRPGLGPKCHTDIERDWNTPAGRDLVVRWSKATGFWKRKVGKV
jgi:Fe-S-cluster containining protein